MTGLFKTILAAGVLMVGTFASTQPVQADDFDKIKSKGSMKIAMSGAYPPFNFVNEKNEVVGFDPSIGKEIAKRIGVEAKIVTTAWDGILAGLLANKYDAIVGSMSITPKRLKVVDFVGPYYSSGRAIFVSEASTFKTMADLKGKKIGVTLGETHEKWARSQDGMNWELKTYKGLPELLLELEHNRIDGFVIDSIPGRVAITKDKRPIREMDLSELKQSSVGVGIAIRKGNPKLAASMQSALDAMMKDGTHKAIGMKWIGADIR